MHTHYTLDRFIRHRIGSLALLLTILATVGCTLTPIQPTVSISDFNNEWKEEYLADERLPFSSENIVSNWWSLFDDVQLNDLVIRAEQNNLDLRLAVNRIAQMRAQLGVVDAKQGPQVSAFASVDREDISDNSKFAALGAKPDGNSYWLGGVDISWELDLWGRLDYLFEGARQGVNASVFDAAAVQVLVRANVVSTYLNLRGAQQQLALLAREVGVREETLTMTQSQFNNGVVGKAAVATSRAKLAHLKSRVEPAKARVHHFMNQLAWLTGEPPQALDALLSSKGQLPQVPKSIPLNLDSELALQRPDIMSASAHLKQATATVGVANADFYPSISLNGRTGFEAFNSDQLSEWDSAFFVVGPSVYLPVFNGGKLQKRLKLSEEKQTAAALKYRKTVLQAWHEIDNALADLQSIYAQHLSLQEAYDEISLALKHTEYGYEQGSMSKLDVLLASEKVTQAAQRLSESQTGVNVALVTLYKTLGGGWQHREPEEGGSL